METPSTEHREMSNGPGPPPCVGAGPGAGGCQLLLILLGLGLSPPSGGESDPGHPEDTGGECQQSASGQFTSDSRPLNTRPGLGDVPRVALTPALLPDLRDSLVTS